MKAVIAYSGGIDSTARAISLLRDHPDVEWTLCFVDMGQTSAAAQRSALEELVRRYPAFKSHIITVDFGFNPTIALNTDVVLQNPGVLPLLWAFCQSYARHIEDTPGTSEVYTGYDRWSDDRQSAYELVVQGALPIPFPPVNHFGANPRGIAGTLDFCGVTWADVDFTVSCSGDPSDPFNEAKVPCHVCAKCKEREAFENA